MVLIIPMGGIGKRFVTAGYSEIKPLITVEGRPMIAHVLDLYPKEDSPIFICRDEHLKTTQLQDILLGLRPRAKILSMAPQDEGPVPAIRQMYKFISDNEEGLLSYCDFTGSWDYDGFKQGIKNYCVDGAIPAYIGFHPHLLGNDFYGHMRWKPD